MSAEATGPGLNSWAAPEQDRPVTLFTGQWADLPFEEMCRLASEWGYDGLEIACWGDHFDVARAAEDESYVQNRRDILEKHGLGCWAISNHLNGQAVCEAIIDERYHNMVNPRVWGDGDPEGVRQRAAEEMKTTARAAAAFGVDTVIGFTGSSVWHYLAMFPPVGDDVIQAGYADFADRWNPIIDVFDEVGVRFAHEVHPSEIAYDYWSTVATLDAIGHRPGFGLNYDPSHMVWQGLDYVGFLWDFKDRIYHVDCKDTKLRMHNGRNGILSSHLPWADPRRGWDFISTGHGDTRWEDIFRMLNHIGYDGPISIEWEDAGDGPAGRRPRGPGLHPDPERDHPADHRLRRRLRAEVARLPGCPAACRPPSRSGNCRPTTATRRCRLSQLDSFRNERAVRAARVEPVHHRRRPDSTRCRKFQSSRFSVW